MLNKGLDQMIHYKLYEFNQKNITAEYCKRHRTRQIGK